MHPLTAAVVLWLGLAFILPLPLPGPTGLGWWPLAKWAGFYWHAPFLSWLGALGSIGGWLGWALALGVLCDGYVRWAERLPVKWRGALVGLVILSLLIVLSAVPVYRAPASTHDGNRPGLTFMELYEG